MMSSCSRVPLPKNHRTDPISLRGSDFSLPPRNGSIVKRDNLPVIIMSNYLPEECFPTANEHGKLEPLLDRIKVVKCEGPIRIVEGAPPAECSTPFQFDDLPPPPPGSQFVLTDDYEDVLIRDPRRRPPACEGCESASGFR